MKRSILVLGLSLALLLFSGSDVLAQASKEISEPITGTWYSTTKVLPLGEDRSFITRDAFGIILADEGKGLFHEATTHWIEAFLMEKGVSKNLVGYGCYFLRNGDKVFATETLEVKTGASPKYKVIIIGGTGKCVNIQGSWEASGHRLTPAAEGIGQAYTKAIFKYQLP